MNAYVFATQAPATALAAVVDQAQGYPKPGVNVGGGIHVSPPFVTQTYAVPFQNATSLQWAYVADPVSTPAVAANAVTLAQQGVSVPAPVTLDATWPGGTGASVGTSQAVVA